MKRATILLTAALLTIGHWARADVKLMEPMPGKTLQARSFDVEADVQNDLSTFGVRVMVGVLVGVGMMVCTMVAVGVTVGEVVGVLVAVGVLVVVGEAVGVWVGVEVTVGVGV